MRIKVILHCEKIPAIYNNRILALIKTALSFSSKEYQENLYNSDYPKPFNYSLVFSNFFITKEWISFNKETMLKENVFNLKDKEFSLYISSSDDIFMFNLIKGLTQLSYFDFSTKDSFNINCKSIKIFLKKIIPIPEKNIKNNEIIFKTMYPFLFNDSEKKSIIFSDDNFEKKINGSLRKILRFYNYNLDSHISFENIQLKKTVIKHVNSGTLRTNKPILFYNGSEGVFKLKGDNKALELIYKNGFGIRTSQGFGMLEIV